MALTLEEVRKIASLARLDLTNEESNRLTIELSAILDYVELLRELDTNDVPPTTHVLEIKDVLRADEPRPCIPREEALRAAPESDGECFRAPKIV